MTLTLRRAAATLLVLWAFVALVVGGQIGWMLILLTGAWLLSRPAHRTAPGHAAPARAPARPVQAVSPAPQEPYWLMAAAGTAAVLHSRDREERPVADDAAEEDDCPDERHDLPAGAAPAAAAWDSRDDAGGIDDFGGYGGGGGWGGGYGGGWGDSGDDFGGGGDWGDGDDW